MYFTKREYINQVDNRQSLFNMGYKTWRLTVAGRANNSNGTTQGVVINQHENRIESDWPADNHSNQATIPLQKKGLRLMTGVS